MMPEFEELERFARQSTLLVLLFVLRLRKCRTDSPVLLVFQRSTCLAVRSK